MNQMQEPTNERKNSIRFMQAGGKLVFAKIQRRINRLYGFSNAFPGRPSTAFEKVASAER